jgi:HK97 family phage major capsid protein
MKTIEQYKEDCKALSERIAAVKAKAENENRDLVTDEVTYLQEVNDEIKKISSMVATLEDVDNTHAKLTAIPEPKTIPKASGIVVVDTNKSKERFMSLGEQLVATVCAGSPSGRIDPRLFTAAASGLNETTPSDGGFLVQTDFSSTLLEQVFETGIIAPLTNRIPISGPSNGIKMNGVDETSRASTRSGGVLGYWLDEAGQKTPSKPKFRQIELTLHKLIGLCYATDELLLDATALEAFIRKAFAAEFGFLLDDAIIRGTGAGMPLGILNSGSLVTIAKEAGQAADTVMWENIVKMYSRIFPQSRQNALWYINQQVETQLMNMSMPVGTGGVPVYMPAGGASAAPYATLFGRPVVPIEQGSALGDVGDIIFADPSGYILGEKGGIESAMSIHVRFNYDESVFRFVMRVDGQPERATPLTPYKGGSGATLSHFVTLAAR